MKKQPFSRLQWRIYYADRLTVDNLTHQPCQVPPGLIVAVVQPDHLNSTHPKYVGRRFVLEVDWIWYNEYYDPPRWEGGDETGMKNKTEHDFDRKITGQRKCWLMADEDWWELKELIHNDPDFPPKGGYLRSEKRAKM